MMVLRGTAPRGAGFTWAFGHFTRVLLAAGVLLAPTHARGAEGASSSRKRVLVLPFRSVGVDADIAAPLATLVDAALGQYRGYDVAAADDLHHLIDIEEAKRKGGCDQDTECLAEIGRKLEADLILTGSVGRIGSAFVIALALTDPNRMTATHRATATARAREEIPKVIPSCVSELVGPAVASPAFHLPRGRKLAFAVLDLKPTGLAPEVAQNLTQVLSAEVKGIENASVISRDDIVTMLQLDQAKQQAGCDDDGCMAALGGALGVDRIISGDAGKVGALYVVNLRLVDVRHGQVENRVAETFSGEEEELLRAVRKAGRELLGIPATAVGRLTVTSSQNASNVYVDEKPVGPAPAVLAGMAADRHAVRVAAPGFFDWHGDVYVNPLETTAVWAPLRARPLPWYQTWWVWTVAGAVVAGGVTAAVLATRNPAVGQVGVQLPTFRTEP